jgi:stage II sporulation protein GA (sporulation sigma-E factor processing peptidase)
MQTIYADILFLINFTMDFLTLFITASILHRKASVIRLSVASAVGGAYGVASVFIEGILIINIFINLAVSYLMCLIVFKKRTLPCYALFYGTGCLLGGAMTALFSAFNRLGLDKAFGGGEAQSDGISVYIFAIIAAISGFVALIGGRLFKRRAIRQDGRLDIEYRGRSLSLVCICDSGNLLREPISRLPCILIELEALRTVLPRELYASLRSEELEKIPLSESSRVRMIPAQSASGQCLLVGLRVDKISLDMGKGAIEIEAYIAISNEKISARGAKALIPGELAFSAA